MPRIKDKGENGYYPIIDRGFTNGNGRTYMAKATGEFRCPKKGEWYLSGAIVGAYYAFNDLRTPYFIARIVKVERVTIIREIAE